MITVYMTEQSLLIYGIFNTFKKIQNGMYSSVSGGEWTRQSWWEHSAFSTWFSMQSSIIKNTALDYWCHHFQQYFRYIVTVSFISGGNRSTRRKPQTCRESLINFITYCCIEYSSPWTAFELTILVVIGTDCIDSC